MEGKKDIDGREDKCITREEVSCGREERRNEGGTDGEKGEWGNAVRNGEEDGFCGFY